MSNYPSGRQGEPGRRGAPDQRLRVWDPPPELRPALHSREDSRQHLLRQRLPDELGYRVQQDRQLVPAHRLGVVTTVAVRKSLAALVVFLVVVFVVFMGFGGALGVVELVILLVIAAVLAVLAYRLWR